MYQILLVDDEEEVREGMAKLVNWEQLGFQVILEATDGRDALEKIEQCTPDIVFTDINMPYMNGIELIEQLHKAYPSIKVIIFSGHEEFEYAKKALNYNVLDYILKPVNLEEIEEVFSKIRIRLDEELEQMRNVDSLKERFVKNLPVLRQKYFNDLILGEVPEHLAIELLNDYRIPELQGETYIVFKLVPSYENEREQENKELIKLSMNDIVDKYIFMKHQGITFQQMDAIIGILVDVKNLSSLFMHLNGICKEIKKVLNVDTYIGVGEAYSGIGNIFKSYKEADVSLTYQVVKDENHVVFIKDIQSIDSEETENDYNYKHDIYQAIKKNDADALNVIANEISSKLLNASWNENARSLYTMQVFSLVMTVMKRYEIKYNKMFREDVNYLMTILQWRSWGISL